MDHKTQQIILNSEVIFLGKQCNLKKCFENLDDDKINSIMDNATTASDLSGFLSNQVTTLATNNVPRVPKYYQDRCIYPRVRLDPEIFKHDSEDIFVMQGVMLSDLRELSTGSRIRVSSVQLDHVASKFILFNQATDFKKLAESLHPKSVHLLCKTGNAYQWVMTHGSIKLIQKYAQPADGCLARSTTDVLKTKFICITGKPGDGKTTLMAQLCKSINESSNNSAFYFKFSQLLDPNVISCLSSFDHEKIIRLISDRVGTNMLGQEILFATLSDVKKACWLFLDDFDEIRDSELKMFQESLACMQESFNSIQVVICARFHKRDVLEETLRCMSYGILPLTQGEQVRILRRYWLELLQPQIDHELPHSKIDHESPEPNIDHELLVNISEGVLISAMHHMLQDDLGSPIICIRLAEFCSKTWRTSEHFAEPICIMSKIYELSEALTDSRLQNLQFDCRKKMELIHSFFAIQILFPSYEKEFCDKLYLPNVNAEDTLRIGLVQAQTSRGYLFTHQMYAEYMLGNFLVSSLQDSDVTSAEYAVKLLLESLSCKRDGGGIRVHTYGKNYYIILCLTLQL